MQKHARSKCEMLCALTPCGLLHLFLNCFFTDYYDKRPVQNPKSPIQNRYGAFSSFARNFSANSNSALASSAFPACCKTCPKR